MRLLSLQIILFSIVCSSSAWGTVFGGSHSLFLVPDGVIDGGLVAPDGFFDDISPGTPIMGTSQYDAAAPLLFEQCFNPSDPTQCYPVFGGGEFDISIGGEQIRTDDFGMGGPYIIPDDRWVFDPATFMPLPPVGDDLAGLTFFQPGVAGYQTIGPGGRWIVELLGLFMQLPANTFPDPPGIAGVDLYALGEMTLSMTVRDSQTGNSGTVFAVVPEPSTALLLSLGLLAMGASRRREV